MEDLIKGLGDLIGGSPKVKASPIQEYVITRQELIRAFGFDKDKYKVNSVTWDSKKKALKIKVQVVE